MGIYNFKELVGNTTTLRLMQRALANNTFPHRVIFGGVLGTGKSTSAGIAAMTLTCEHQDCGQPCFRCPSCKSNQITLESMGESSNLKIINMGKLQNKSDVAELIKNVFVLQNGIGNMVYVFEEVHALKELGSVQTAFLKELDSMPLNVYIIMCTTRVNDLIPELRSRTRIFNFNRLTRVESRVLLKKQALTLGVKELPVKLENLILDHSKGIPRELISDLQFTLDNSVSEEELKEFFQRISDSTFIQLFQTLKGQSITSFIEAIEMLLEKKESDNIVQELGNFIIKVVWLIEGGINDGFTRTESLEIAELFNNEDLGKLIPIIESLNKSVTNTNLKIALLKMRMCLQNRNPSSIVADKNKIAALDRIQSAHLQDEVKESSNEINEFKLSRLSIGKLDKF